jgi:hypothetical protein
VEIIPGHRDHRSGDRDKLITITPELVITFRRNPDHDQPGISDHHRPESPVRWLGDRKGIERITTTWNKTVIDRTNEIRSWVDVCYETVRRGVKVFGYANNHYGGHAPATIVSFGNCGGERGCLRSGIRFLNR